MVAHAVTVGRADWAGAVTGVDWDAQPIFQNWEELMCAQVEAQSRRRHHREIASSMRQSKRGHPGNLSYLALLSEVLKKKGLVQEVDL